jgi:histone H3/H4
MRAQKKTLRKIQKEQNNTNLIIPAAPFRRLVVDAAKCNGKKMRFKKSALKALQTDAEAYMIDMLHDANAVAMAQGRDTLMVGDINLLRVVRNDIT